jgi:hypothetical protein
MIFSRTTPFSAQALIYLSPCPENHFNRLVDQRKSSACMNIYIPTLVGLNKVYELKDYLSMHGLIKHPFFLSF